MDLESEIDIFYDCDECDQTFSSVSDMDKHKIEAHDKRYKCPFCDISFAKYANLKNHISHKHENRKTRIVSTEICYDKMNELMEENGEAIENPKLNICGDCNKTFSTVRGLKHHMSIIHERKQQYSCPDCSKTFRLESTLEKHIDREHLKLGRESLYYTCDECGKTLQSGSLFHVCKNEVPLTCDECGESFVNSDEFKKHKRSFHRNTYRCDKCGKDYTDKNKFASHIKDVHSVELEIETQENQVTTNNNIKKHKCDFCEIAFARPENLKRHIQRMHKVKSNC